MIPISTCPNLDHVHFKSTDPRKEQKQNNHQNAYFRHHMLLSGESDDERKTPTRHNTHGFAIIGCRFIKSKGY